MRRERAQVELLRVTGQQAGKHGALRASVEGNRAEASVREVAEAKPAAASSNQSEHVRMTWGSCLSRKQT